MIGHRRYKFYGRDIKQAKRLILEQDQMHFLLKGKYVKIIIGR